MQNFVQAWLFSNISHIQRSASVRATLCDCMSFWDNPFNHRLVSVNITAIHLWDVMWTVNKLVRWRDITKHKTCDLNPLCDRLVDNTIVLCLAKWPPSPTPSHTWMAAKRGPVLWLAKWPPTPSQTRVAAKRGPVLWLAKWPPTPSHTRMAAKRGPVLWLTKWPPTPSHTRVAAKTGPEGRMPACS